MNVGHNNSVFVSYSHKDKKWLDELKVQLKPLVRERRVRLWADTDIQAGLWPDQIRDAIASMKVAVLLVSPEFLASDFIAANELPPILRKVKREGALVLPVLVRPSLFERERKLSRFQSVNPPSKTLIEMTPAQRARLWVKLTEQIEMAVTTAAVTNVTGQVDAITGQVLHYIKGTPERRPDRRYWFRYARRGTSLVTMHGNKVAQTVSGAKLHSRLSREQRKHLRVLETSMTDRYNDWTRLYPRRNSASVRKRLDRVLLEMEQDLDGVLRFIKSCGLILDDHYLEIRSALAEHAGRTGSRDRLPARSRTR
jgi:hypothetical protein